LSRYILDTPASSHFKRGAPQVFIDHDVAHVYAEIVISLRELGIPLPSNEVWIGACAAATGATVLTYDAHFRHIRRVGSIVLPS
jgi:predicted nucleic acid-binding protein